MRIGIILTGYNMAEYVAPCLQAWLAARGNHLGGNDFRICAVSVPFAGFPYSPPDDTIHLLEGLQRVGCIDHLITEPINIPETTARGMALDWLKADGANLIWQVDLDEFYTETQIAAILSFVASNPWITWFKLSLKNYVFDDKTYLIEPFAPPRVHRVKAPSGAEALAFMADNDIIYSGPDPTQPSTTIPPSVAFIQHMTWQQGTRSRDKIWYQLKARGWPTCSFSWDNDKGLVFNPALPPPKIARDPDPVSAP